MVGSGRPISLGFSFMYRYGKVLVGWLACAFGSYVFTLLDFTFPAIYFFVQLVPLFLFSSLVIGLVYSCFLSILASWSPALPSICPSSLLSLPG